MEREVEALKEAEATVDQELEEIQGDIGRFTRLLDNINANIDAVERELEGFRVNPTEEV